MISRLKAFASDNYAGVHHAVLAAINACNDNHVPAYGDDLFTANAKQLFKQHFGSDAETLFVFSGTGANILALDAVTAPFHSILCAESAHINNDECGAIEKITGSRLVPIVSGDGKLTPELIKPHLKGFGVPHHAQPRVISISQTTEYGTVYKIEEIKALSALAHSHNMLLHMDGARISNAAASLSCHFRDFTTDAGVDVLSFGGTKNGLMYGEAVVFLNAKYAESAEFYRKQNGQLPSKQRYVAAQFQALLEGDLWLRSAQHANAMARRLKDGLIGIKHVEITQAVEANVVFARLSETMIKKLREKFVFYVWNEHTHEVRWMTSFDTTEAEVDEFVAHIKKCAR